jgi:GAF domain-containing protein
MQKQFGDSGENLAADAAQTAGGGMAGKDDQSELYTNLAIDIDALFANETDMIANIANAAASIYHGLPALNWAGFYRAHGSELVLGPFQGKPACVRIPFGRGVCGTAARRRQSVLVEDVHAFPGHIACDAISRSELVVPLIRGATLIGVLDLDSPLPARFDAADQVGCEALAAVIVRHLRSTLPG